LSSLTVFDTVLELLQCIIVPLQERGRPPKVHLQDTVEEMHKFNAIRKLKVAEFY